LGYDKVALWAEFRQQLVEQLVQVKSEGAAARSGTRVDGDHRPENRGERAAVTSQGYLAHALGQRVTQLQADLDFLDRVEPSRRDRITMGALFSLVEGEEERWYVVLPGGLGTRLAGGEVAVVSPNSPLVSSLAGLGEGDAGTMQRGGQAVEVEVTEVY